MTTLSPELTKRFWIARGWNQGLSPSGLIKWKSPLGFWRKNLPSIDWNAVHEAMDTLDEEERAVYAATLWVKVMPIDEHLSLNETIQRHVFATISQVTKAVCEVLEARKK